MKAEPLQELETAQKNFRFSLAQRMLYNDESSKKRTITSLAEQRQQITSLSPHQQPAKLKVEHQYKFNEGQNNLRQDRPDNFSSSSFNMPPGHVISESLNYVYEETKGQQNEDQTIGSFESGFMAPRNFADSAKNSDEKWMAPLFLEEIFDPNSRCFYPKKSCYPGYGEFSLEELKARKWFEYFERKRAEDERLKRESDLIRKRQEEERLRQESEARRLIAYQSWNCHNQNSCNFHGSEYYQHSPYENSPNYSYAHDHSSYQSPLNYFYHQGMPALQTHPEPYFHSAVNHQYREFMPTEIYQPITQVPHIAELNSALSLTTSQEKHENYDVEYLIDHSSEIDPTILQQPIVESFDNAEESSCDKSEEEALTPVVNSYMLDDLEEQIEASTIRFSSNGKSRDKKITIKFRKKKSNSDLPAHHENNKMSSHFMETCSTSSSSQGKKKTKKLRLQNEVFSTLETDSTQGSFVQSSSNSCSSTAHNEYNSDSTNVSFTGCMTPAKKQVSCMSIGSSSIPRESELISSQNDDSICSFTGDQNSFFLAENDEVLKKRRYEKALSTINEHLSKREIDPFNSELCRALLIKLNFPNRENTTDYLLTNCNLPKLSKNLVVPINGISYQVEKEVGKGAYGAVFR